MINGLIWYLTKENLRSVLGPQKKEGKNSSGLPAVVPVDPGKWCCMETKFGPWGTRQKTF